MRADAQKNYDSLRKAATSLFAKDGPSVPLEAIARAAGVGIGTLYRHFPTRKDLLEAVYVDETTKLTKKAAHLADSDPYAEALSQWLQTVVRFAAERGAFSDLMRLTLEDTHSAIVAAGAELVTQAQKTGELRKDVTILDLLRLVHGIVPQNTSVNELKKVDTLISLIMSGAQQKSK